MNTNKADSVSDFIQNYKEICLKNFIGKLLIEEQTKIKTTRFGIQNALEGSAKNLDSDYKSFMSYIDNEKDIAKKNDEVIKPFNNYSSLTIKLMKIKYFMRRKKISK